jgi:hypothetical protein
MNLFLKITAFFEAITGLGLILIPKTVIQLLFLASINDTGGIIAAMIAGAAILAIAILCWFSGRNLKVYPLIKTLLFYNMLIIAIAAYGRINYKIEGIGILVVIGFHTILALWSLALIRRSSL